MAAQPDFEWDPKKNDENIDKHGVSFETAQYAFYDSRRIIASDRKHSTRKKNAISVTAWLMNESLR